jgi:uncharacterized RDD family membrane protein YckC
MAFSQAAPATPAALAQPPFAGLVRRLTAYFTDLAISASIFLLLALAMRGFRGVGLWRPAAGQAGEVYDPMTAWHALGGGGKLAVVLGFVLSMGVIYFTLFESSVWQATFGKRLLDIHVTDDEGRRIRIRRALGRWFWKILLGYFWVNIASLATIPSTKEKKALHDYLARTLVVRGRPAPGGSLEAWRVVAAFGIPFVWLMATFLATS